MSRRRRLLALRRGPGRAMPGRCPGRRRGRGGRHDRGGHHDAGRIDAGRDRQVLARLADPANQGHGEMIVPGIGGVGRIHHIGVIIVIIEEDLAVFRRGRHPERGIGPAARLLDHDAAVTVVAADGHRRLHLAGGRGFDRPDLAHRRPLHVAERVRGLGHLQHRLGLASGQQGGRRHQDCRRQSHSHSSAPLCSWNPVHARGVDSPRHQIKQCLDGMPLSETHLRISEAGH
ncbi:conserved hypothetical protein [Gluconacetobacter diazotrophicus PA1 5]|uniref:Uncharacterized protein n=1 Tax=Gluconacetobacter diazotrophicus (strain ATCC 49037 / DSM 5601 / CCUG 37298 / CIP 103539 / LMG 7603 / PAl5) TaxID=272568 RepID=A9HFX1_GLUDA|nr:conserved hypothetical protein [Gluconacetobacter diazotrophicus PA1 5]